jgi:2-polyprenyl-3-methyl-5-hydroxy-6-metoxy-1,4-benzoquinol methylase
MKDGYIMDEYWEARYNEEGAMWKFEPSDSAAKAEALFSENNINKILIPGVGYGRNAKLFHDKGYNITGIEISKSAIELAAQNGLNFNIHHGSVTQMPFNNQKYDGIFCYALIHLLNKNQRKEFLKSCYNQLNNNGLMIFTVVSTKANMFGKGKQLSHNRFEIMKGLNVFFYENNAVINEFKHFGLLDYYDIDEPIKHMVGQEPLKCKFVICKK